MQKEIKTYMIRAEDGTYSKGGSRPSFSKTGKKWSTMGHLNSHLNNLDRYGKQSYVEKKCTIVEFTLTESSHTTIDDALKACQMRKEERAAERKRLHDEWKKQEELELLRKLQEKYKDVA